MAYNPVIGSIYHLYHISHLYIAFWGIICYLPPIKGTRNNHRSKHYINLLSKRLGCGPGFFSSATKYFLTFDRRQHSTKGFRQNCSVFLWTRGLSPWRLRFCNGKSPFLIRDTSSLGWFFGVFLVNDNKNLTKFKGAKGLPKICQIVFCNPRNLPQVLNLSASDLLHVIGFSRSKSLITSLPG